MQIKTIPVDYDWKRIWSDPTDISGVDRPVLLRMLFEMLLIREFEHVLLELKKDDCIWGPVHTSIGQEAVAAATIAALRAADKVAGSHRAHHLFLSKALQHVVDPGWDPVSEALPRAGRDVIRRTLAEIMGLSEGFCGGRGGSMHLRWLEAGVLGTNAIVAGGVPPAVGAAYAEKFRRTSGLVVAFLGDGGVNQGAFHEAANLAGLWNLPIILFIENNQYAVSTPVQAASAVPDLSLRALAYNMVGRVVDGHDVLGMYSAVRDVAESIRNGGRPAVIEAKCYRHLHHAGELTGSAYGYRDKEEEQKQLDQDAVANFPLTLCKTGMVTEAEVNSIRKGIAEVIEEAVNHCTDGTRPHRVRSALWPKPDSVELGTRSSGEELNGLTYREIEDFTSFKEVKYSDVIAWVTGRWLERDDQTFVIGEDIANLGGGPYGATKGLSARFPDRVIGTPISEAGFVGLGCGLSMSGARPIVEIMFPDFSLVAADQLFNQIAKARHMYGGSTDLPIVVRTRIATGCGYGGQHSMDPIGLYALFVGWRIVAPSNAFDYVGLFNTAMASNDPVLILEHHSLYGHRFQLPKDDSDYYIPFGKAKIVESGSDVTVLTYGVMVRRVTAMLKAFAEKGISVEIVDLRTVDLPAIDYATVSASLRKTGALVTVEEAAQGYAIGDRIAQRLYEADFDYLDGPIGCVSSLNVPNSVSKVLETAAIVSDDQIFSTVSAIAQRKWK